MTWPEDIVDAGRLFEVLGYTTDAPDVVGLEAAERITNLADAVERARISGRIKRLSAKDSASGEVVGYGYRRADVRKVVGLE